MLDEIFEFIGDGFSAIGEFFSGMFDDMGEISYTGLVFGVLGVGFIFVTHKWMLAPFLSKMGNLTAIFWGGATYISTGIAGYFIGKHFENS